MPKLCAKQTTPTSSSSSSSRKYHPEMFRSHSLGIYHPFFIHWLICIAKWVPSHTTFYY